MKINTKGVEATAPMEYIKEAGKYLFKIVGLEQDGYSTQGNEKVKVVFECKQIVMKDNTPALGTAILKHNEVYCADDNLVWKVAILRDALRAPECFDFNNLIGYSVIADVYMKEYNSKFYANVSTLAYSKANDALGVIPEDVEEEIQAPASYAPVETAPIEIEEEELPF
jgi:hypothetical protein